MKSVTLTTQQGDLTITRESEAYDEDTIIIEHTYGLIRLKESDAEALVVALSIVLGKKGN